MAREGNILAYRAHSILLDVFNKLVILSVEKKIKDSGFATITQFLYQNQNGQLNTYRIFLENKHLKSTKNIFYERISHEMFPNNLNIFDQNEINVNNKTD